MAVENDGKCSLTMVFDNFEGLVSWVRSEQAVRDRQIVGKGVKVVARPDLALVDRKRRFMLANPLAGGQFVRLETQPELTKVAVPETGAPVGKGE